MVSFQGAPTQETASLGSRWWEPVTEFAVHALVGAAAFAVVAVPAVVLDYLREEIIIRDTVVRYAIQAGEYLLLIADLLLFAIFLVRTGVRSARRF